MQLDASFFQLFHPILKLPLSVNISFRTRNIWTHRGGGGGGGGMKQRTKRQCLNFVILVSKDNTKESLESLKHARVDN